VPLSRLAANQDAYLGKEVLFPVPALRARPYAGRAVSVRGRFGFNTHVGHLIRIATISAAG
jgi:hypothetical protein